MKKIISAIVILAVVCMTPSFAQYGFWKDGNPTFSKIESYASVKIDSLIMLSSIRNFASQDSNFKFVLSGDDWLCPDEIDIKSASDIDYRNFLGSNLYLITDAEGNRVVEIDPDIVEEVWEFKGAIGTDRYLEKPVDAVSYLESEGGESVRKILIVDQGRHRIIKVIQENKAIQWQYGNETEGIGKNQLSNPSDAVPIPDSGKVFICDKGNHRVILVQEADNSISWQWGRTIGSLNNPVDLEYDSRTKEILITDQGNHRVIKVSVVTNAITWQFGITGVASSGNDGLNLPTDADLLPGGHVLICDAGNNRLIEVDTYENIIWQFHTELKNLKDADRLINPSPVSDNNKHLIIAGNLPARIGYQTTDFISSKLDIGKDVGFDSLFWVADTAAGISSIKIQLRSANVLGELESAEWKGLNGAGSYYAKPGLPIHWSHDGNRFYQFKATLITQNPLYTPVLNDVILTYRYFDTEVAGSIITEAISDSANYIITRWKNLKFSTLLPEKFEHRNKIELKITLLDATTNQPILSPFTASNVDTANIKSLSDIEELKQRQQFKIQASLRTNNSSVSPILKSIEVEWERTESTPSEIYFVNSNLEPVNHYRFSESYAAGQKYIDRIAIFLKDPNLEKVEQVVPITIRALNSRDTITVNLQYQAATGGYLLTPTEPAIIFNKETPIFTGILEVLDRDTLFIEYTDPTNPTDISRDSVLAISDTPGILYFENQFGVMIDTTSIGDTIRVRLIQEYDRNITPRQDTVYAIVYDDKTDDEEQIVLFELPDSNLTFYSGEFISQPGLPIVLKNTRVNNDGRLQTISGSKIGIIYDDSFLQAPILQVKASPIPPDTLWNLGGGPLAFDMAPNPFYADQNSLLKIRASSSIGNLTLTKIEIYTLAGEKITEIDGTKLTFYGAYPIPKDQFGFADNWWDRKNRDGSPVSSGTYFVKLFGKTDGSDETLTALKKLVIIK